MATTEEFSTQCFICDKDVPEGNAGMECSNCHTRYCLWAHKKELNYKGIWTGYGETNCLKCGQLIFGATSEEDSQNTKEKATRPTGFYILTENAPQECPSCGGEKIKAILKPKMSTLARILHVVFGVFGIWAINQATLSGQFDDMNGAVIFVIWAGVLWVAASFIWLGLTLRPIGRYLLAPDFIKHAFCGDCQHHWIVEKK
ncbi:MAG: hypothetical protein HN736_12485 [Anaerolineae bacterium]|jgi:hypothetical protein|nr:hypothetical protein [Anaerolineae bacterium]MBT4312029.1 hypothetical protein [Anaerolineae bacterium]MBT4459254.1 hypothetical protein [Anaerolineae bacterium]MBT4842006.1 hypothetical protein [Anaerolineae bacterium]MBT6061269.1 hypothetical protein [Anaerolineae bacterium]